MSNDELLRDRQRFWHRFLQISTAAVAAAVLILILLAILAL